MLTMSSSVGFVAIEVNPSLAFLVARVRSAGLVADMMVMVSNYRFLLCVI